VEKFILAEAPTGTGKSTRLSRFPPRSGFPKTSKRWVVATHTINLQEQLLHKTFHLCRDFWIGNQGRSRQSRNNYLCPKSSRTLEDELPLFRDEELDSAEAYEELMTWGRSTKTGDRSELSFVPAGSLWERLGSESDTCRNRLPCPDACHYQMRGAEFSPPTCSWSITTSSPPTSH